MTSKNRIIIGVAVLLLGYGVLVYRGIYVTKEEIVFTVVPLPVTETNQECVPLPAPLAWALVVGGAFIVLNGATTRIA